MNNNETESAHIGWAVRSVESPFNDKRLEVVGWETISHWTRMKEIRVRVSDKRMHCFHNSAPVISASIINRNQSFSIVSKIFNDYVKDKKIILIYITGVIKKQREFYFVRKCIFIL